MFWLYNRTGDKLLLKVADLLHEQAYPWRQIFRENLFLDDPDDFHPKHAVNVAQALKAPVVYWQKSSDPADRAAYRAGLVHLMRDHGTSYGINTGSEMVSGRSTVEGVELCAIVENMLSAETALRILGEARLGDELELVAFNSLPAAFSKSMRQHVYYTLANNIRAQRGPIGYEIDYADGRTPAPRSGCPCCCYNLHMGWPKLVQNAWAATNDGGLAALAYVPSEVTTTVAKGVEAKVVCDTDYPFSEMIKLNVTPVKSVAFPLHLRIPGWCQRPTVAINGQPYGDVKSGEFLIVSRTWNPGDVVELTFPMTVEKFSGVNQSVSLRRGPLVFSLALHENWKILEAGKLPGFEAYEVTSESPWNYALDADCQQVAQVSTRPVPLNPFAQGQAPVDLVVPARRIPEWRERADGLIPYDPPVSPVKSDAELEHIVLVPFGSQMLRITDFPHLGTPAAALTEWRASFNTNSLDEWIVYRGGFVRDERLHLVLGSKALATHTNFADLLLEANVQIGDRGNAGLLFRASKASIGCDQYRGYYVGLEPVTGELIVGKADDQYFPLTRTQVAAKPNAIHRLKVEAIGSAIRVWFDDSPQPVIDLTDESFQTGAVGVRSFAYTASFGELGARRTIR